MSEERLAGTVEYITFHNEQNGFTVLELSTEDELITVVGTFPMVSVGEELLLVGKYDTHPSFGRQFKAEMCERKMPSTAASILRYLSEGGIKGIGPATAKKIVERFGENSLEIIEKEPHRLTIIKGITAHRARQISDEFMRQFGMREVMLFLAQYGFDSEQSLAVYKLFGPASVDRLKANPFFLCNDELCFNFEQVDAMAAELGFEKNFSFRIYAGIEYVLRHNLQNGHTCIPVDKLTELSSGLLEIEIEKISEIIEYMCGANRLFMTQTGGKTFAYLPYMYRAESYCAHRVTELSRMSFSSKIDIEAELSKIETELNIEYQSLQKEAIRNAMTRGIMVLTGGPGTGKTTTLNGIIRLFQKQNMKLCLAAPTGRAAKRVTEVTGNEAKTIHRLLEVEWGPGHRPVFMKNERNPLDCDVVIVDELSMVDITLFESLLAAMPFGSRLIMVGDSDQLPSVGAGNVLNDVIESGCVPVVELTEIFRQAMKSAIITNAHKIVKGEEPDLSRKDADFFYLARQNPLDGADTVCDLYCRRLPEAYDFLSDGDIQVLCPSRKREMGTININNLIQQRVNPPATGKREIKQKGFILREGDRVMQIKNNYDIMWDRKDGSDGTGVFNGDVGLLRSVDIKSDRIIVSFDDRNAYYTLEDAEQLELAYAVTVHKSQGSEFDCVILPVLDTPPQLKYRNLLYTAVTRAKKLLVLVGSADVVNQMVHNDKRTKRYTGLKTMITEQADEL